jgi:spore germination protein KA
MLVIFEILREAGVRMPKPAGQAVSIVGALVLGEVAVNAGIVSPLMVIIVALTGILSFVVTPFNDAMAIMRLPILLIASVFGLYGVFWSYLLLLIHLASLRSFGAPYMSPFMPFNFKDLKDTVIRVPWWAMKTRPTAIMGKETDRVADSGKPTPYKNKDGDKIK